MLVVVVVEKDIIEVFEADVGEKEVFGVWLACPLYYPMQTSRITPSLHIICIGYIFYHTPSEFNNFTDENRRWLREAWWYCVIKFRLVLQG